MLTPCNLRCEYLSNPLGIDTLQPRLSWVLASEQRAQTQAAYQIIVADSLQALHAANGNLWDSGRVDSDQSVHVVYAGVPLQSEMRCWWQVRVWDQDGGASDFSQPTWWQMGLLDTAEWQGQWISLDTGPAGDAELRPCPYLRRVFQVEQRVRRATLYATARGLYRASIHGQGVGDAVLAPDWTDYNQRVLYDTYDVTDLLQIGDNVLGVILGDGWYCGYLGGKGDRYLYGANPQLLIQLNIEYVDSSKTSVATDQAWRGKSGPILSSDLYMGEIYDARREMPGWDQADFDDAGWQPVRVEAHPHAVKLTAQSAQPIRMTQMVKPVAVTQPVAGVYVFDLGQNLAGWVRLQVAGEAGTRIQLRHAEVLNPDGSLYTENLRSARATDTYILKGGGLEIWEPHFTYHGFRYVAVEGYPGEATLDTVAGCVIHTDLPEVGTFECSSPVVNQLWRNTLWSQRSNSHGVLTDCPQRDERLGWMGDAQLFARTASMNMDTAALFRRWMLSIEDAQSPEGAFPDVAPWLAGSSDGAPGWGDAGIIIPWTVYQLYGDSQIIERHYAAMARWMAYIHEANPNLLRTERLHNDYGDWLSYNADTPSDLLATAYWAYDAWLMARMAQAIGRSQDALEYQELFEKIRAAFVEAYVSSDGRIRGETQTCYALALHMNLLPPHLRQMAARHLVEDIKQRDWHLSTGFIGTAYLLQVLTETGNVDVAYRLLNNDTCPSWGYMVRHGATTVWERWDGLAGTPEDGGRVFDAARPTWVHPVFGTAPRMNSFNHFAFGTVCEWLYRYVAGIDLDRDRPGFRHVLIRPHIGGGLTWARATYRSIYGEISSAWEVAGDVVSLVITIPPNTTATVCPAGTPVSDIQEDGRPLVDVRDAVHAGDAIVIGVGSGRYEFSYPLSRRLAARQG